MEKVRVEISVFGIVQGVGFRYFTRSYARKLNINGFVENMPDGSVHIVAEGDKKAIEDFIEIVKKGPYGARVDRVEVEFSTPTNEFVDFEVY